MIRFEDLGAPAGVVAPAARADMFWEGMWRAAATTAWLTVPSGAHAGGYDAVVG